jgi:hypothetical protein
LRQVRTLPATTALLCALATACAQMTVDTEARTSVAPDAAPLAREARVVEAQLEARYTQRGASLDVELLELRTCQRVDTLPARRVERTIRRPDAMIYWEYSLAAVALGLAALAFIRPEGFASVTYNDAIGSYERDPKTGYRLGGVFSAVGAGFLIGGIVDSVRARDTTRTLDTTVRREGPAAPCEAPSVPAGQRQLELEVGDTRLTAVTDLDGRAHFALPEPTPAPTEPTALESTLRVALAAEFSIPLLAPYARSAGAPNTGTVRARPQ